MFRIKLFGSASIEGPEGPVTGRPVQRRRLALLALLAIARDRGVRRDKLIGYLWPDADPDRARHLLSDSVYRINQAVGGEGVIAVGDDLRLNPERLPCDAWEFGAAIERGDWQTAVDLYIAPFLDGFYLTDADELERWADAQRERLARDHAHAIEALAESAERVASPTAAVRWWRVLAAHDPYSSRIALRLMRALDAAGDRAAALQHARVHTLMLDQEMSLAPDPDLLAYVAELRKPPRMPVAPDATTAPDLTTAPLPPNAHGAMHPPAASAIPPAPPSRVARRSKRLMAALLVMLVGIAAAAVALERRSEGGVQAIAVLPFSDLSADGQYEYFADGMTEELIARLAHVDGLNVVGRSSVFAFRGRSVDVREIASQLNVTAVLEGSVRHSGDRLRIVVQLIDAQNGYQLWTETYERQAEDVFAIQDDISLQVVTRLRGQVSGDIASSLADRSTPSPDHEAFNLYLKGRYEWHRRTEESLLAAADYFGQAAARSPDYALAHAGLGDAYAVLGFYDFMPPRDAFPAAAEAAQRALELQPSLGEAHATLGYVALYHEWDWQRADREFRRAIELEPAYSTAYQWYANFLNAMGRFDEAAAAMGDAMELDPLSVIANAALGWVLYYSGDYTRAIAQCTRALELDPDFALAYLWRAMAYEELGDMDTALPDFQRAVRLSGGSAIHVALHARALAGAGRPDEARALIQQLEQRDGTSYVPPYEMAKVHEALGDRAAALRALQRAYEHRSHSMVFLAVDPQLASLHGDPAFGNLVEQVGLARTPGASWLAR